MKDTLYKYVLVIHSMIVSMPQNKTKIRYADLIPKLEVKQKSEFSSQGDVIENLNEIGKRIPNLI